MHTNPGLGARRARLSLQYATKIKSLPKHPAHNAVFDHKYMKLFDARPSAIRTFGLRIKQFLTSSNIEFSDILETPSSFILPPWCVKPPKIVLHLVHLKKDRTDALIYEQHFLEIRDKYRNYIPVYTDRSRDGYSMACATVFPSDTELSMRLPDSASIFTAEIWTIITALEKKCICIQIYIFYRLTFVSPTFVTYEAGTSLNWDGDTKVVFLNIANKDIIFGWLPSHVGIKVNKKADSAAKSALDLPHAQVGVPYTDFKHLISQYIFSTWQDDWNGAVANKLHAVKPVLGDWQSSYRRCGKDEVVLCRARIGNRHLTHSYILKKDPPPQCEHCQCIPTVRHILVECNHIA